MNKKIITMMSAMVMCFSAMPLQVTHAETDNNIVIPDCTETYVDVMPEWIPTNFTEALQFDNEYGKTHIKDGYICCVRKIYSDHYTYTKEISGDSITELRSYTFKFEMPEKPDESDTEAYQEYLDFLCLNGIDEYYVRYAEKYDSVIKSDFEYEVSVYKMKPSGKGEINLIWENSNNWSNAVTLSFESSADGEITETDLYGWLPDSVGECNKLDKVSIINGHIVYCDYVCNDGGLSLITERDGMAKLECTNSTYIGDSRVMLPPPGSSPITLEAYKPITSGTVKVTFKEAQNWEGGMVDETVVKYYSVDEDGSITEIDESEFTPLNMGDCNLDGKTGISDVVMLKKWLMGSGELKCWQNVDFNNDNKVDVFDLVLMKKSLLEKLPAVSPESDEVTDSDVTMIKQAVLEKYPDADMRDFTFVYNPDSRLDGKTFSVYYKGVLLHSYEDINAVGNAYVIIRNEKDNLKSVKIDLINSELYKDVELDGEYKTVEEIKQSVDKYELADAEKEPQFIIYADCTGNLNYEFKPAYVIEWNDYERIYDAVTGEEIEYIPYYVV